MIEQHIAKLVQMGHDPLSGLDECDVLIIRCLWRREVRFWSCVLNLLIFSATARIRKCRLPVPDLSLLRVCVCVLKTKEQYLAFPHSHIDIHRPAKHALHPDGSQITTDINHNTPPSLRLV